MENIFSCGKLCTQYLHIVIIIAFFGGLGGLIYSLQFESHRSAHFLGKVFYLLQVRMLRIILLCQVLV